MKAIAAAISGARKLGVMGFLAIASGTFAGCAEIKVSPDDVTLPLDQNVSFAAKVDKDVETFSGKPENVTWTAYDVTEQSPARISPQGTFTARLPGVYEVTAHSGHDEGHARVTVPDGVTFNPKENPTQTTTVSSAGGLVMPPALPSPPVTGPGWQDSNFRRAFYVDNRLGRDLHRGRLQVALLRTPGAARPGSRALQAGRPLFQAGPRAVQGSPGVFQPGSPRFHDVDAGVGNGNYLLTIPILKLPGRGQDLSLTLFYNSKVWLKTNDYTIVFNHDHDWPAPGWSLGFGKAERIGSIGVAVKDADGTIHPFAGKVGSYASGFTNFNSYTTDGSLLGCFFQLYNGRLSTGRVEWPNGTVVEYGAPSDDGNLMYPTTITDANGNYITITYRNNTGPEIESIVDTLGRTIDFHYDANGRLVAVTAPAFGGGTRTAVRLHYGALNLWYNFDISKLMAMVNPSDWKVDAVYFPDTSTGYWFGDADSYSSYGMIEKVKQQRGMHIQGQSLSDQGTIVQGTFTRERDYNYPLTPDPTLADAPTYTAIAESWAGMESVFPAITRYSVKKGVSPDACDLGRPLSQVYALYPDLTQSTQLLYDDPGNFEDGLLCQQTTYDPNGNFLRQSTVAWRQGDLDSPRITEVSVTDERKQKATTQYGYASYPNGITDVVQLDYDGQPLRYTQTGYLSTGHIVNLPGTVRVYNCPMVQGQRRCNDIASRTDYNYDQYDKWPLSNTPGVVSHSDAYNPYAPAYWVPPDDELECDGNGGVNPAPVRDGGSGCVKVHHPGYWASDYNKETQHRGNVTQIIRYPDATNSNRQITETRTYDIDGNMVSTQPACCEETDFGYTLETQFAYPTTVSHGSPESSNVRINTSAGYDFNCRPSGRCWRGTGLQVSTTDANGRKTSFDYDAALRPKQVTLPTSATITYDYDDAAMAISQTSRYADGKLAAQSRLHMNGLSLARQTETLAPNNTWNAVATKYDSLGRVWQQSQPFQFGSNEQPRWNQISYDALGRITGLQGADNSRILTFYNETSRPSSASALPGLTKRVVDPIGRERWYRMDALGNLAEVVEPNAYGNSPGSLGQSGNTATSYTYNALGLLASVVQGPNKQRRDFRYDSLGRLLAQHLAEKSATLDDAGNFFGGFEFGGQWSDVFTYDDRSNLTSHTDARGIKTVYDYGNDPLGRLQHVTYDMTKFGDTFYPVLPAPNVTYTYRTTGDLTQVSDITTSEIPYLTPATAESYQYDLQGLLFSKQLTIGEWPILALDYKFDDFDRPFEVTYPAEYGFASVARKRINYSYGIGGSLAGLQIDGVDYASQPTYNPAKQLTSLTVGATGPGQAVETYSYDSKTGLMNGQQVQLGSSCVLDRSSCALDVGYSYFPNRQLAQLTDNLPGHKESEAYVYDGLGRLRTATGGPPNAELWEETYAFDSYGNRTGVSASGQTADGFPIPLDGLPLLSYDAGTNHVNTQGFWYDAAGNQIRAQRADNSWFRYQYDAAGRLIQVGDDQGNFLEAYRYGADRRRFSTLSAALGSAQTYYVWDGNRVVAEYTQSLQPPAPSEQPSAAQLAWSKSAVYLGDRLLASFLPGQPIQHVYYHHPDGRGTRLITNNGDGSVTEQHILPFGTVIPRGASGVINPIFTSYDRSSQTGLDYAINRQYDPQQRFLEVDPREVATAQLTLPQTLNLYTYVANDPVNRGDPLGLGCEVGLFSANCADGGIELNVPLSQYQSDVATAQQNFGNFVWYGAGLLGTFSGGVLAGPASYGANWAQGAFIEATNNLVNNAATNLANQGTEVTNGWGLDLTGVTAEQTSGQNGTQGTEVTNSWGLDLTGVTAGQTSGQNGTQGTEVTNSWGLDLTGVTAGQTSGQNGTQVMEVPGSSSGLDFINDYTSASGCTSGEPCSK